jgi:two-component system alkaline phosphatase synthesis response regulator PhoP
MAKKVLVIDDDNNTVRFLTVALEENGYETAYAYDGVEGFEKVENEKPDLIVLDVMMPKRSGFVLFAQLRKSEEYKDIPVIMLTGVADSLSELESKADDTFESPYDSLREKLRLKIQQMREQGLKPEMYVDKPIDPDDLITKVKELIGE